MPNTTWAWRSPTWAAGPRPSNTWKSPTASSPIRDSSRPSTASAPAAVERLQPNSSDAQYNLGVALANLGRGSEALQHLEIAYRLKPDPELKQTIDRLRSGGH